MLGCVACTPAASLACAFSPLAVAAAGNVLVPCAPRESREIAVSAACAVSEPMKDSDADAFAYFGRLRLLLGTSGAVRARHGSGVCVLLLDNDCRVEYGVVSSAVRYRHRRYRLGVFSTTAAAAGERYTEGAFSRSMSPFCGSSRTGTEAVLLERSRALYPPGPPR
ncbi:hypothetical protein C8J57DRAFT_1493459 [Mycena rebaudengoi]|nr:hypothetical protein C8J57DRAFT_1493459 [Mycena rebaudengoi]